MKYVRLRLLYVCFFIVGICSGQDLTKILVKAVSQRGEKEMARLDSVDFQFAISVNEATGFLDVTNHGEAGANLMYAVRSKAEKTKVDFARDTLNAAIRLYNMRLYNLSYQGYTSARRYMEKHGLQDQVNYIRCISGLALVSIIRGKTSEADALLKQAVSLSEKKLGKASVAYAANINSRGKLNQLVGNYNEAEQDFSESARLVEKKFGAVSLQSAILLNNRAMLGLVMGRSEESVQMMTRSAQIAEQVFDDPFKGKNSFENRIFLSNLAWVYLAVGKTAEAERTYLRIKNIYESREQKSNPEYASVLEQLASLYIKTEKNDAAEKLLLNAADIYKRKFSEQNSAYAGALHQLGVVYRNLNRFPDAERFGRQALEIRFKVLGEHHPDYITSMEQLGITLWRKGNIQQAYNLMKNSLDRSLGFINQYFAPMSEAEKTRYWETLQPRFQRFYAFAISNEKAIPQMRTDIFNYQLVIKALLLNATGKIKRAIINSGDPDLVKDYLNWLGKKEELTHLYALSEKELKDEQVDIPTLEVLVNDLEKDLSSRSAQFSNAFASQQISIPGLASKLLADEALVEVVRVRGYERDFTDQVSYIFLVLMQGASRPLMVTVSNGSELETRYARYYKNAVTARQPDAISYKQFWQKADSLLVGKKQIYFSPDGVYNQINLNTLRLPDGDYILNRYTVIAMGNPKDLISLKKTKKITTNKTAFLMGDPEFDGRMPELPGTKTELERIQRILGASGYQVTIKNRKSASETNLKSLKSPAILHLATHGFFESDNEIGVGEAELNPLLRSGLMLATTENIKVRNQKVGYETSDNGVLTAYEAMSLNLEGTQLVILSACETGLGEIRAGEGVYGLQRAFLVAGAQALIMSLWKVDDVATQELMTNFYSAIEKSSDIFQAFRSAQRKLMVKYPDPYFWGGFIFVSN